VVHEMGRGPSSAVHVVSCLMLACLHVLNHVRRHAIMHTKTARNCGKLLTGGEVSVSPIHQQHSSVSELPC